MNNTRNIGTSKEVKTGQIIRIEQEQLSKHLDKVVRGTVEETLNQLLDAEADRLCQAGRYERTDARKAYQGRALHPQIEYKGRRGQAEGSQTRWLKGV